MQSAAPDPSVQEVHEQGGLTVVLILTRRYIKDDSSTKRSRYDGQYSAYGGYGGGYGYGAAPQPAGYQAISNTKDNPPCNTLFIGNLGDGVSARTCRQNQGSICRAQASW
jgi:hypothetical protein